MAGCSGNIEALAVQLAPEGFVFCRPPRLPGFVEFGAATFRAGTSDSQRPRHEAGLLGSLVYRPMVFRRNDIGCIAACAWRSAAKADDLVALKRAKREIDQRLIRQAGELLAALISQLHGERAADAITCIPCGHSRRPDCFGKRLAQCVAEVLGLPFLQVFADRFCSGVSHPKEFVKLPPLQQIADPLPSMIVVDDLAVSGWHVEVLAAHPYPKGHPRQAQAGAGSRALVATKGVCAATIRISSPCSAPPRNRSKSDEAGTQQHD